jgi:hypothetical protein
MPDSALLRERDRGIQGCTSGRRNRPEVPCDTIVCRLVAGRLIIRCRNCNTDHVFEVREGVIAPVRSVLARALTDPPPRR